MRFLRFDDDPIEVHSNRAEDDHSNAGSDAMPCHRPWTVRASVPITAFCLLATSASSAPADDLTRPIRGETPSGVPIRFLGTNSCSSNACHNRGNARGSSELSLLEPKTGWEYAYWQRYDPHTRAYAVLETDESRLIEKNLRKLTSIELASPQRDGLCLSCHVHQNFSNTGHGPGFSASDGVSCEGCHGAAEGWNAVHYQTGWQHLSRDQKAEYGFVPLGSMADRSRACTPCHVGSTYEDPIHGLVDVNHDLIAAGHPRLNFEFASYHAQYPKHWSDVAERSADPAYEARAWVVGQLTTAESALKLLSMRASRSKSEPIDDNPPALLPTSDTGPHAGPWPEFAEYNCYACHHDLRGGVPLAVGVTSAVPGQLPWGTWYTPMTDAIARELPPSAGGWTELLSQVDAELSLPLPDPGRVNMKVDEALEILDGWLSELSVRPLDAAEVDRLMIAVVDHLRESADPTWDRNAQLYLALAALNAAKGDLNPSRRDPATDRALNELLSRLQFRADTNSPEEYRVEGLDQLLTAIRPGTGIED